MSEDGRKPARAPRLREPWEPAPWENADVASLKALASGVANEHQQKRALKYIVETLGMTYEHTHFKDPRNTDLANGRRFVGLQIVKLVNLDSRLMKKTKEGSNG